MTAMGVSPDLLSAAIWAMTNRTIKVPTDFHGQAQKIRELYAQGDSSGLVDTLSDFMVECALVKFSIETKLEDATYVDLLNEWLDTINSDYRGKPGIEVGVRGFAKQYFRERWKYSSFPIVKIASFNKKIKIGSNEIKVPEGLFILDGGSVKAKSKDENVISVFNYDYYLGDESDKNKIDGKNYLVTKPNGRIFDDYPIPFLHRRGILKNWIILDTIKNKQGELIADIIPYLLMLKKGIKAANSKSVSEAELQKSVDTLQKTLEQANLTGGVPLRATNVDESIEEFIPSIENMFKKELFSQGEKAILSGFGLIDMQHIGDVSRQESIINPKPLIEEVTTGVGDFICILNDLIAYINENNKKRYPKLVKSDPFVHYNKIQAFITEEIRKKLSEAHSRGNLSEQTYNEVAVGVGFELERKRRKVEAKEGIEVDFYPRVIQNVEGKGADMKSQLLDKNGNAKPDDKIKSPTTTEKYSDA